MFDHRLRILASKANETGRHINWHRKTDSFALRYEERAKLIDENIEDAALMERVSDLLRQGFANQVTNEKLKPHVELGVGVCHHVLEKIFETQGLALSLYALDRDDDIGTEIDARKIINEEIDTVPQFAPCKSEMADWVVSTIRRMIYGTDLDIRRYLQT